MKPKYQDILDLASYPPTWYDQNGTPRYCEFLPHIVGGQEAVLLKIECASCRERFLVAMNWSDTMSEDDMYPISYFIKNYRAAPNYGDPPRHNHKGNRCAGETMTCDDIRIMEFWRRNDDLEWERVLGYEIRLDE